MKKIIAFVIAILVLMSACSASDVKTDDAAATAFGLDAVYVCADEASAMTDEMLPQNVQKTSMASSISAAEDKSIIVSPEIICEENREALKSALDGGCRLLVLGEISDDELCKYLGAEYIELPDEAAAPQLDGDPTENGASDVTVIDVSDYPQFGRLIYRSDDGLATAGIFIEPDREEELAAETIEYCFAHDYLKYNTARLGVSGSAQPESLGSWVQMRTASDTYSNTYAKITSSLRLSKNSANPVSTGQFYYYLAYKVDVDPKASYKTSYAILNVAGKSASKIYDYAPTNQSCASGYSVSIGLPPNISFSFTPGTSVSIKKVSGGLDSSSISIKYQAINSSGSSAITGDTMQCQAHIEGYQSDKYFFGYGSFKVEMSNASGNNRTILADNALEVSGS